ncbi:hypothetical protein CDD83_1478 [Cordyceps sp. RAO-2017]|nr:hypothetical protein CDD83_1478 [Cordyceps sp. RAO-2017]
MGQGLVDRIRAKLELFRLEQRYTRHRHRRSTFVSNAVYVDGEYVFQTPNSTGSSSTSSSPSRTDALHGQRAGSVAVAVADDDQLADPATTLPQLPPPERKRLSRFSSMPGFGSGFGKDRPQPLDPTTSIIR